MRAATSTSKSDCDGQSFHARAWRALVRIGRYHCSPPPQLWSHSIASSSTSLYLTLRHAGCPNHRTVHVRLAFRRRATLVNLFRFFDQASSPLVPRIHNPSGLLRFLLRAAEPLSSGPQRPIFEFLVRFQTQAIHPVLPHPAMAADGTCCFEVYASLGWIALDHA